HVTGVQTCALPIWPREQRGRGTGEVCGWCGGRLSAQGTTRLRSRAGEPRCAGRTRYSAKAWVRARGTLATTPAKQRLTHRDDRGERSGTTERLRPVPGPADPGRLRPGADLGPPAPPGASQLLPVPFQPLPPLPRW